MKASGKKLITNGFNPRSRLYIAIIVKTCIIISFKVAFNVKEKEMKKKMEKPIDRSILVNNILHNENV